MLPVKAHPRDPWQTPASVLPDSCIVKDGGELLPPSRSREAALMQGGKYADQVIWQRVDEHEMLIGDGMIELESI